MSDFTDNPPPDAVVILVSPPVGSGPSIPGSAQGEHRCVCNRPLIVSPSSLRWLAAHPAVDVLHLCGGCAQRYGPALASGELGGPPIAEVEMMPGGAEELRAAGLGQIAADDQVVRDRWRWLFGMPR